MIKIIISSLLVFSFLFSNAQAIRKGDVKFNVGIKAPYLFYDRDESTIPVFISTTYTFNRKFSAGLFTGFAQTRWYGPMYNIIYNRVAFGAMGTYHMNEDLKNHFNIPVNDENWDFYVNFFTGFSNYWFKQYWPTFPDHMAYPRKELFFSPSLGVRYMPKPNIGFFAETGPGIMGALSIGLVIKIETGEDKVEKSGETPQSQI